MFDPADRTKPHRDDHVLRSPRVLGLFTKYWEPGTVKTRLAATVGDQAAAELHRLFFLQLTRQLGSLDAKRLILLSPAGARAAVSATTGPGWQIADQGEGSLGDRLGRFFSAQLQQDARVVAIGADSPQLTAARITEAWQCLDDSAAVIGPAEDGGYYLLGLRGPWRASYAALFADIPWGTESVAAATLRACGRIGIDVAELPVELDVDRHADLARLAERLAQRQDAGPLLAALAPLLAHPPAGS